MKQKKTLYGQFGGDLKASLLGGGATPSLLKPPPGGSEDVHCPCCRQPFDPAKSTPSFEEIFGHMEHAVYVLCPSCQQAFDGGDCRTKHMVAHDCMWNMHEDFSDGRFRTRWAVTSLLTLHDNNFNPVKALGDDPQLPRAIYNDLHQTGVTLRRADGFNSNLRVWGDGWGFDDEAL